MTSGIIVDEGLPEADLRKALSLIDATVDVVAETLLTSDSGEVEAASLRKAEAIAEDRGWGRVIYVTDQVLVRDGSPVRHQGVADGRLLLVSVSALGAVRVAHRLARELGPLLNGEVSAQSAPAGKVGLFLGLVRANQPSRLLAVLKGVFVGIAATGGFGIFYGSIWSLAQVVSYPRLILLSVVAIAVLTTSLIVTNGLWQKPADRSPGWLGHLGNTVTAATIFLTGIVVFVLGVFGLTLLSLIIAPGSYVAEQIGRDSVGAVTYVRIGWFSANLGVLAGAIASNFDRSPKIRSAVHNPREYARRQREGSYGN